MKKNGFTLVELLGVVTVIALLIILVTPNITGSSTAVKEKAFRTKINNIEAAAVQYGIDNYRSIVNGANDDLPGYGLESTEDVIYRTHTIKIRNLVPEYVVKETETGDKFIIDPRDSTKFLDDLDITIKINTNTRKVTAKVIVPESETESGS